MAAKKSAIWVPLTFELTQPQAAKIEAGRRILGLETQSEVVREAIGRFDFERYDAKKPAHRQISVRLPPELRDKLRRCARLKNVSIGELLRVAVEELVTVARKPRDRARGPSKVERPGRKR